MRALNVLLSILVSLLIAGAVLEIGLRLLGLGPAHTINRFDPELGWSLQPGAEQTRKTSEFDVTFTINELGLRDDPMQSPAKPAGMFRVVMLGDSFVQGYTVSREDLFVDELEKLWKAEGRLVDVVNAGTEGWSTDQEVRWLETRGRSFQPDLVVLFPYENDLWWNGRRSYLRFPKPRYTPEGSLERRTLDDPGPSPWTERWALTRLVTAFTKEGPPTWKDERTGKRIFAEYGAYYDPPPAPIAELWQESYARTRGAFRALKRMCEEELHADLLVVPIPNKAAILPGARAQLERMLGQGDWSADRPVEKVLALCRDLEIPALDPRAELRADAERGETLYFAKDWHLDPSGNRALARIVNAGIEERHLFPPTHAAQRAADAAALAPPEHEQAGFPGWAKLFLVLWLALSTLYALTYRDEKLWVAPLKVGGLLALVFAIVLGGKALLALLPPAAGKLVALVFVLGVLGFVIYKLGRRLATIAELFVCFVRRGHWYLMPLVVVLLTIGSLLVVAASSPLIAPFIYTLF